MDVYLYPSWDRYRDTCGSYLEHEGKHQPAQLLRHGRRLIVLTHMPDEAVYDFHDDPLVLPEAKFHEYVEGRGAIQTIDSMLYQPDRDSIRLRAGGRFLNKWERHLNVSRAWGVDARRPVPVRQWMWYDSIIGRLNVIL